MKSSCSWSTTAEAWVESAHRGESGLHWWGFIRQQSLGTLRRLGRRRGSKRCRRRSDVDRIPRGSLLSRTSAGGYFITNTSPPTSEFEFRMKEVQRDFHSRRCPLEPRAWSPSDILAFNACVLESFQIGAIRRDLSKFPLER